MFEDPDLSAENSRGYLLKILGNVGHESINVFSKIEAFGI